MAGENSGPARDFIPDDLLHQFDFLFDDRINKLKFHSGKVMKINADGTAYLFSEDLEGCVIDDPLTWVIAQPATQIQSAVPPRFGQNVLWSYTDGEGGAACYYGLDRSKTKSLNAGLLKEVIHEGLLPNQSISYDAATQTYTIKNLAQTIVISPAGINIQSTVINATSPANNLTGNLTMTGILLVNGMDVFATVTALSAALSALNALYLAHTHAVSTAPGVTGPPM
jgi:phage baseplate assembly protein gpV